MFGDDDVPVDADGWPIPAPLAEDYQQRVRVDDLYAFPPPVKVQRSPEPVRQHDESMFGASPSPVSPQNHFGGFGLSESASGGQSRGGDDGVVDVNPVQLLVGLVTGVAMWFALRMFKFEGLDRWLSWALIAATAFCSVSLSGRRGWVVGAVFALLVIAPFLLVRVSVLAVVLVLVVGVVVADRCFR